MSHRSYTIVFIPIGSDKEIFLTVGASNAEEALEQLELIVDIEEICEIRSED